MNTPLERLRTVPEERGEKSKPPRRALHLAIWIGCALVLLGELLIDKHVETAIEHWFGFHAVFGLIAAFILVLVAKLLRLSISRPENYYDDR